MVTRWDHDLNGDLVKKGLSKMKVELVYCGIGVAGFNPDRPLGDREGSWISHGLASVGAVTAAAGHDVSLMDLRQLSDFEEIGRRVAENPADVYGVSVSAVDWPLVLRPLYEIKKNAPEAKIIVGGIHPSIFPGNYVTIGAVNCTVQGEGEVVFPELLAMIQDGEKIPSFVPQGMFKPDLKTLPWVKRDLFDYRRELSCNFAPDHETPAITMLAGRGCPYKCNYCQPAENAIFGKPFRIRPHTDVIEELLHLKAKYHFKSITFWDDTFTFNKKWINQLCDLWPFRDVKIAACSRADIICKHEDMVERLAEIGLDWFVIGLESGSQRILDLIQKGTTVDQNKKAARICRKYGIKVFGTYMYGLPTETKEEATATARMIEEIAPEHASPFYYTPIQGTGLYDFCVEHDLLLDEAKERTIERTGRYLPSIKGVDYDHIGELMKPGC